MTLKPRAPQQEEMTDVIAFLDSNMRKINHGRCAKNTALTQNTHNIRILRDENNISPRRSQTHDHENALRHFNVCMMGSVLTDPTLRVRSQHPSDRRLHRQAIGDILVLWTDLLILQNSALNSPTEIV